MFGCSARNFSIHGGRDSQNPDCAFSIVDYNRPHPPSDSSFLPDIQLKGAAPDLSAATYQIHDESHTIGNALRWMLMKKYVSYIVLPRGHMH